MSGKVPDGESTYGPVEYEALTGMPRAEYERQLVEFARESFRKGVTPGLILEGVSIEDARLVVLLSLAAFPGRRFGWDAIVWPSPHPDDFEGTPEWGELVATFVNLSVADGRTTAPPDEHGVVWLG